MEDAAIEDRVAPGPQFNIEAGEGKKRRERFGCDCVDERCGV